nr:hypothetical protein B0A51_03384 [Rachicladosporium sp. CCFEE 5018]
MADTANTTATSAPNDESPTQKQARLRREKRQAKLATEGEDRLAKIKQLNGGVAPPDEVLGGPALPKPSGSKAATVTDSEDPDEVDISSHPYTPANGSGAGTPRGGRQEQDPFMQAMLQMQSQQGQAGGSRGAGSQADVDPMQQMMQQMMGMMGADPNDPNAQPGEMPQIGQMLSTIMGGAGGGGGANAQLQPASRSTYVWRLTHALFALALGVYITITSTFNGTQLSRSESAFTVPENRSPFGPRLFWMFATAELMLQSTRYFMEGGQLRGGGWLATIANSGFVPPPYAHYIRTIGSYIRIYTTIVEWDYAPTGWDNWLGIPIELSPRAQFSGQLKYGTKWEKALYRGYTDATFSDEVNDLIEIMFVNKLDKYYATMHSMGLEYTKSQGEGADCPNNTAPGQTVVLTPSNAVPPIDLGAGPGDCVVYKWMVNSAAGPNFGEPSKVHSYHSYIALQQDTDAGLIGPQIVYAAGKMNETMANYREIPFLFMIYDEADSWLSSANAAKLQQGGSGQSSGVQRGSSTQSQTSAAATSTTFTSPATFNQTAPTAGPPIGHPHGQTTERQQNAWQPHPSQGSPHNRRQQGGPPAGAQSIPPINTESLFAGNVSVWKPQVTNLAGAGQFMGAPNFFTINGYIFGNNPTFEMCQDDKVIWYVNAYGSASHVFHMHGNGFSWDGGSYPAIEIGPGVGRTLYMNATGVGKWQVVCHVAAHMTLGMVANYQRGAKGSTPTRQPLTHFLCLPLVTASSRPALESNSEIFRRDVCYEHDGVPGNVHPKAVRPVGTLHLTLGVMSLKKGDLDRATALLQSLDLEQLLRGQAVTSRPSFGNVSTGSSTKKANKSSPLTVTLKGLESMHDPRKTSILFVAPHDSSDRLMNFCLAAQKIFREAGFLLPDDRPLTLHATIVNTIYAKRAATQGQAPSEPQTQVDGSGIVRPIRAGATDGGSGHGRNANAPLKINAVDLLDRYRHFVWASDVVLESLALCEMGAKCIADASGRVVDHQYTVVASTPPPTL